MDVSNASYYIHEKTKNKGQKQWDTSKKYLKKNNYFISLKWKVYTHCLVISCWGLTNPGIFGDQWKPMTIRLNLKIGIGYRCHQVADAKFAVGDQKFIGYPIYANDGTRDSQSIALMTTDSINITKNTKGSGNSSSKAELLTPLFPNFLIFHQCLQLYERWQHWISRLPLGKHRSPSLQKFFSTTELIVCNLSLLSQEFSHVKKLDVTRCWYNTDLSLPVCQLYHRISTGNGTRCQTNHQMGIGLHRSSNIPCLITSLKLQY